MYMNIQLIAWKYFSCKRTHRYNYEANETTDESLEEDFIIDDEHYYKLEEQEREERRQVRKH